jgi:hypothetical protein
MLDVSQGRVTYKKRSWNAKYMNNHQFLEKLDNSSSSLWIIVLCNILDGFDAKLYDDDFVRQAMEWWRQDFIRLQTGNPTANEEELLETSLCTLLLPEDSLGFKPSKPKPDFRLNCRVSVSGQNYAHSMHVDSFFRHVIHEDDRSTLVKDGLINPRPPTSPITLLILLFV